MRDFQTIVKELAEIRSKARDIEIQKRRLEFEMENHPDFYASGSGGGGWLKEKEWQAKDE